jgi:hypothetical protein
MEACVIAVKKTSVKKGCSRRPGLLTEGVSSGRQALMFRAAGADSGVLISLLL